MVLKSIEMKGFKSFSHKTQLSFPVGIVSIIGPNGSGKSNVLDAVRWVLGEKSAKNLRGEKMEDVIFSGTKIHKSMNFCEVEIIFGNEDQFLNIDFSEVAIKRKAYRNGESKFYINNTPCRQKDIKELLLDSGIGKEGYSIISQGRIDEIVNSNPVQRRRIFEEACKISKNRYQKEESERKLSTVKENLERINDIYYEIEKQIKPLKTQSENAKIYLELKSELKKSDVNRIILELGDIQGEYSTLQKMMDEKNANLTILETDFAIKMSMEEKLGIQVEELYLNLEKIVDNKNKLILLKGNLENQISSNTIFLENSDKQSQKSLEQIEKAKESMVRAKVEYDQRKNELKDFHLKLSQLSESQESLEKEEIKLKLLADETMKNIENLKENLIVSMNNKNFINSQINQFKDQKEEEFKKISDSETAKTEQENKLILLNKELKEDEETYSIEQNKFNELLQEQDEIVEQMDRNFKSAEEKLAEISSLLIAIKALESKKSVFDDMEAHYEGMSNSVKSVIKEKSLTGIIDVLANVISVDGEYEKAIEAALGGAIQNIVTKTSDNAKAAIEFLKSKKLGRATFLPIDAVKGQEIQVEDEIIASSLIKTKEEYKGIIKQLLGRTIIVSNMDEGIKSSKLHGQKYKIVTKQGEIFSPGGAITGGAYVKSGNILSRKREIQDLKVAIEKEYLKKEQLELSRNEYVKCAEEFKLKKEIQENKIEEIRNILGNLKINTIDKKNKISYEKTKLENIFRENDDIKNIQDNNMAKLGSLEEQDRQLELEIADIKLKLDALIEDNYERQENWGNLAKEIAKTRENVSSYKGQLESREILLNQAKEIYREFEQRHEDYKQENQEFLESLGNSKDKLFELKQQLDEAAKTLILAENEENSTRTEHTTAREKLGLLKDEVKHIEQNRFIQMEERYQIENKLSRVENVISNGSSRLLEEYNLTLEEANELKEESVNTSKSHIGKIKSNINALGNINLDAIDEYEKISERYNLFSTQKSDLELSLEELEKITINIEKNMKKEFKQEFTKINNLFKETFKELFGGGEGELVLADEDDILNCEIEIHAQPPGKKLKNISVMSGGEKALTAIAILFAILMTRPTPFCFLDEIDAPLDDVNIYRYNNYIKGLAAKTQFITITHRRGTMEASDYIYGVTMEDKGVSKIISLKLEEAENYIEN